MCHYASEKPLLWVAFDKMCLLNTRMLKKNITEFVSCLLLPRPESWESIWFCQAFPLGASIPAGPECLNLHRPVRSVPAPADGSGHSAHLPAQHPYRRQTCHQPEKLRYSSGQLTHYQDNIMWLKSRLESKMKFKVGCVISTPLWKILYKS